MHNNITKHNNISKKEKEELLSLFRIPINFFADDNKLNNFHDKFKKLKEEIDNTIANLPSNTVNDDMDELDNEEGSVTLKIVCHYNKKGFNKNQLLKNISLLENVSEVIEE